MCKSDMAFLQVLVHGLHSILFFFLLPFLRFAHTKLPCVLLKSGIRMARVANSGREKCRTCHDTIMPVIESLQLLLEDCKLTSSP